MDYKLTFEDGSSAYLEHHGIKGMKWGVRNAETLAKYQGSRGAKHLLSKMEKTNQRIGAEIWRGNEKKARRLSNKLARQQIKYHAKEAKAGGNDALKGQVGSIRKETQTAQNALTRYGRRAGLGYLVGGPLGYAVALNTKGAKNDLKTYNDLVTRYANDNFKAAKKHVETGKVEINIVLEAVKENRLVGAVPDGSGGMYYVTKPKNN